MYFGVSHMWILGRKRAGIRAGMDSNAPGPSVDVPNRGPAIDLRKDNPNQTQPKKQRTLFQSGMFRVENGAQNSVVITDVHVDTRV
jgi:hypothetical protein